MFINWKKLVLLSKLVDVGHFVIFLFNKHIFIEEKYMGHINVWFGLVKAK